MATLGDFYDMLCQKLRSGCFAAGSAKSLTSCINIAHRMQGCALPKPAHNNRGGGCHTIPAVVALAHPPAVCTRSSIVARPESSSPGEPGALCWQVQLGCTDMLRRQVRGRVCPSGRKRRGVDRARFGATGEHPENSNGGRRHNGTCLCRYRPHCRLWAGLPLLHKSRYSAHVSIHLPDSERGGFRAAKRGGATCTPRSVAINGTFGSGRAEAHGRAQCSFIATVASGCLRTNSATPPHRRPASSHPNQPHRVT